MGEFIVSARKYRPNAFEEVVGQKHVTDTLKNEIESDQLAQAFLFTGPRGVGKTTCARILAKVINLEEGEEDRDFSFNIFELDAASNNSVEDIRSLNEQVRIPPQTGKYKVYIIDEVHMLSSSAFNAFLKTLEEPPKYAIFILATTEKHKILPTILSRCQVFNFNRITVAEIVTQLKEICTKENIQAEEEALHLIGQKADGGMRDALSIFDQMVSFTGGNITYENAIENLNVLDTDYFFNLTDKILTQNIPESLLLFDEVLQKGFDGSLMLSGLSEHIRNLLVSQTKDTEKLLDVSESFQSKYKEQAMRADLTFLLNALNIINQSEIHYKTSKNQRLHVELALMKLCRIKSTVETASLMREDLKKKSSGLKPESEESPTEAQVDTSSPEPTIESKESSETKETTEIDSVPDTIQEPSQKIETTVEDKEETPEEKKEEVPEEKKTKKLTKVSSHYKMTKIPRLNQVSEPEGSDEEKTETEEASDEISVKKEEISSKPDEKLETNDENVTSLWEKFTLEQLKPERISLITLLKAIKPAIKDDNLLVTLQSEQQVQLFEKVRPIVFGFINKYLTTKLLACYTEIDDSVQLGNSQPYTDGEILEHFIEKNPAVKEAVKQLGLRIK
jgi:DNA polymerase-3 subunit gamma/tau